jgi:hypothetical protein
MRIRVIQEPPVDAVDGIDLRRYRLGVVYTVGNGIGSLLLAEGWAVPVAPGEPEVLMALDDLLDGPSRRDPQALRKDPPNLIRERRGDVLQFPRSLAADLKKASK